jgi:hypothetical protein
MLDPSLGTMPQDDIGRQVERRGAERLADGRAIRRGRFWAAVAADPRAGFRSGGAGALVRLIQRARLRPGGAGADPLRRS